MFNASAEKLKAEADSMRERLERERASVTAAEEEASVVRSAQEKERAEARQKLRQLEAELEREKQVGWSVGRSVDESVCLKVFLCGPCNCFSREESSSK